MTRLRRCLQDQALTFELANKLADNNFVMRDIETGTEWKQSTGAGLRGDLEAISDKPEKMIKYENAPRPDDI